MEAIFGRIEEMVRENGREVVENWVARLSAIRAGG